MNEEAMRVLKLVEQGKLTAEQASELLRAMGKEPVPEPTRPALGAGTVDGPRPTWIGIYVTDGDDGEQVRVRIPFGLASCVEKFVPKTVMAKMRAGDAEVDLREIFANLRNATIGDLVSVDGSDGTHVRIRCE